MGKTFTWDDWHRLDAAGEAGRLLAFLDTVAAIPEIRAGKQRGLDLLEPRPGQRILDVGCGTGGDVFDLAERLAPGGEAVGVDLSARAVGIARSRVGERTGVRFVEGDATALPFAAATFDAVRADRVLQHIEAFDVAVAEMVRVTRPGGALVITEVALKSGAAPAREDSGAEEPAQASQHRDTVAFLPLVLRRAGVERVEFDTSQATVTLPDDAAEVIGLPPGLVDVSFLYVVGRRGGG